MARVNASGVRLQSIGRFLGLNEAPDGDSGIRKGEAVEMSNFKITDGGALQVRGGTKDVAGLLENNDYAITVSAAPETLFTNVNEATSTFTAYPTVGVSANGTLSLSGTPVSVNYDNRSGYRHYYYRKPDGVIYKFDGVDFTATGGYSAVRDTSELLYLCDGTPGGGIACYGSITFVEDSIYVAGSQTGAFPEGSNPAFGKYYDSAVHGVCAITYYNCIENKWYGQKLLTAPCGTYEWRFRKVSASPSCEHPAVYGIWSGYIGGAERLVAACGGHLWSLTETGGEWSKTDIGSLASTERVSFFAFNSKLYVLTGSNYYVWDGNSSFSPVSGYAPLIAVSAPYSGGGTPLEKANRLTGSKRQRFSPDGTHDTFQLAEKSIASVDSVKLNGAAIPAGTTWEGHAFYIPYNSSGTVKVIISATLDQETGQILSTTPPPAGVNTLEIKWTKGNGDRGSVTGMKYSELFSGSTDNRVFLYGDGSNKALYSGINEEGLPDAEYFPADNEISVGEANTPLTGLVRHYDRLLAFKEDSAYTIRYDTLALESETTQAVFYITPLNRSIGNCAAGQALLVENHPRTLDGRSVYEWVSAGGEITNDQRNAKRISQRVENSLRSFDMKGAFAYFDKINHEYYIIQGGSALVHNTENDTWYMYRDFPASCMIVYKDEVYIGTQDGFIRHFSRNYLTDNGTPITAYWESGSMDFGDEFRTKSSPLLWVSVKPESHSSLNVTVITDSKREQGGAGLVNCGTEAVSSGIFSFSELDFSSFSFGTGRLTHPRRLKIGAKDFSRYKLVFTSRPNSTATITGAGIEFRVIGRS